MQKKAALTFALVGVAAAWLAVGCGEEDDNGDGDNPPPSGVYEQTQPKYVLANVEYAFNHKDKVVLGGCLSEDFEYFFNPTDVGKKAGNYTLPEKWTKTDMMKAAPNMFTGCEAIWIANYWQNVGNPAPGKTDLQINDVMFDFNVTDQGHYSISEMGALMNYYFVKGADGKWRLRKWRDRSGWEGVEMLPNSFGSVIAMYYNGPDIP